MPKAIEFKLLSTAEMERSIGKLKTFEGKQPKKTIAAAELKTKFKDWQKVAARPGAADIKLNRIAAVPIKSGDVESIRMIHESQTPTAEALVGRKLTPDKLVGTLYSSLCTLEFKKMESEFATRTRNARTPEAKAKVQSEWKEVVKAAGQAFNAGGLKDVNEDKLRSFSAELSKSKANFNAIVNIANTAVAVKGQEAIALTGRTVLSAGFVAETAALIDPNIIVTTIGDLCSKPFAEGTFTKNFHKGFSLTVRIPYWCPTWTNPFRVCHKNVTLAGLSLDLNVQVGYRVTCCGAVVWGQASAQACATIVGLKFCAGCTAKITGVAGIGRTGSGSNCTYGLGINAQLTCTFGRVTVLNVQAPFGFNVSGPCPPAGLC